MESITTLYKLPIRVNDRNKYWQDKTRAAWRHGCKLFIILVFLLSVTPLQAQEKPESPADCNRVIREEFDDWNTELAGYIEAGFNSASDVNRLSDHLEDGIDFAYTECQEIRAEYFNRVAMVYAQWTSATMMALDEYGLYDRFVLGRIMQSATDMYSLMRESGNFALPHVDW
jgi:hypothetical protein